MTTARNGAGGPVTAAVLAWLLWVGAASAATTRFVWPDSSSPAPPFTNWATAAHTIQAAVDAADDGDTVLVTNGVYAAGGRAIVGTMTNRIALDRAVTLRSIKGPRWTVIEGTPRPDNTNGIGAVRCAYLGSNAVLIGFTLHNGHTQTTGDAATALRGGGAWAADSGLLIDCVITNCSAAEDGGGIYGGMAYACTISGNIAGEDGGGADECLVLSCTLSHNVAGDDAGGADECELYDSVLADNRADDEGGAASESMLENCVVAGNQAGPEAGGVDECTVRRSVLTRNSARQGGGAGECILEHCILTENQAIFEGGGVLNSVMYGCVLAGNTALNGYGGGAHRSSLYHCTVTGNSALSFGGGISFSEVFNSIVFYNTASSNSNHYASALQFSCTTPLPDEGPGNVADEPQLASQSHLASGSPCIGAGNPDYRLDVDIDAEPWLDPPSMGADEFTPAGAVGPLVVNLQARYTNVAVGFAVEFEARIEGHAAANRWDFGDGVMASNVLAATHAWAASGEYPVTVTAFNEDYPEGVTATWTIVVEDAVYYVDAVSVNPSHPYTNWATAARTIQEAIIASTVAGRLVLVTNGVYATGGLRGESSQLTNRIALTHEVVVQSVNGPEVTVIQGANSTQYWVRCAYVGSNAVLSGFTLTNGWVGGGWGGGVSAESSGIVSNCVITGNSARWGGGVYGGNIYHCILSQNTSADYAGGAYRAALYDSCFTNNVAGGSGGGAGSCGLYNCQLAGNQASEDGGGGDDCVMRNCSLIGNRSLNDGGGVSDSTLYHCTVTDNAARWHGGGVINCDLFNSIVYFNQALLEPNHAESSFEYSCTTPLPEEGIGNLAAEPRLASLVHLAPDSPCVGAGQRRYSQGVDIDGDTWADPPCMGADQIVGYTSQGLDSVTIEAPYTTVNVGYSLTLTARIEGHAGTHYWYFGDGTLVANTPIVNHAWQVPGRYSVTLTVFNPSLSQSLSATLIVLVEDRVYYVNWTNANPVHPFTSWETAATSIQDAIGASPAAGRVVLVHDGTYGAGGTIVQGTLMNRVALTNAVTVRSVNGPQATQIWGGPGRCAYVANGSVLSGFTLTLGATLSSTADVLDRNGAGAWCEFRGTLTNCLLAGNRAGHSGGGVHGGIVLNSIFSGNSATKDGGGADESWLSGCLLTNNLAYDDAGGANHSQLWNCVLATNRAYRHAGGADACVLNHCTLSGNIAAETGGGARSSDLFHCTLIGNLATGRRYSEDGDPHYARGLGGGTSDSDLSHCILTGNRAADYGGGATGSELFSCVLARNTATNGGGAYNCELTHCTVTGNAATNTAGGVRNCEVYNSIVFFNAAPTNSNHDGWLTLPPLGFGYGSEIEYSCTSPLPERGTGNLDQDPQLASESHLAATSPCIGAGHPGYSEGVDIDGEPWADPPCMGTDQLVAGAATGTLEVLIQTPYPHVPAGFALTLSALIEGRTTGNRWDLGDGTVLTNQAHVLHIWNEPGAYPVRLTAYNDDFPLGVTATLILDVNESVHYVNRSVLLSRIPR